MTQMLETQSFGEDTANPPLLIVHGLFGAGRNWRGLARNLSGDRRVVTVDMRNHGDSFWDPSNDYDDMAGDLARVIRAQGGAMDVLGHSMGGKAAMVLALDEPELVNRLIVADIAPVGYAHSQTSNIKVMRRVPLDQITRRSEADAIMAEYLADPGVRAFLLQSLVLDESGNRWSLNLDALEANMAHIVGFPDITGRYQGPAFFLRGQNSTYVLDDYRPKIKTLFPRFELATLESAGHWLHAEQPRAFLEQVRGFLNG